MCLDAAGDNGEADSDIIYSTCMRGADDQLWALANPSSNDDADSPDDDDSTNEDYFWLVNKASGKCLNFDETFTVGKGSRAYLSDCDWVDENQRWRMSSDFFQLKNRIDGMCLAVISLRQAVGKGTQVATQKSKTYNTVRLWSCVGSSGNYPNQKLLPVSNIVVFSDQKWHLIARRNGWYHVKNRMLGRRLLNDREIKQKGL